MTAADGSTPLTMLPPPVTRDRYWYWRGWRIHYQVMPATTPQPHQPPILLLHGFGASLEQWRDNARVLAQSRTVYALDLLGVGGSQKAAAIFNAELGGDRKSGGEGKR